MTQRTLLKDVAASCWNVRMYWGTKRPEWTIYVEKPKGVLPRWERVKVTKPHLEDALAEALREAHRREDAHGPLSLSVQAGEAVEAKDKVIF